MKISEFGYWENSTSEGHGVDAGLAKGLVEFLKETGAKSIYDFGCGTGYYTNTLYEAGFDCTGYDGNPNTRELAGNLCFIANLATPLYMKPVDWVLCLEVAEHVPELFESILLSNIHRHNNCGVIISWSIPEYGGDGHVNPKDNYYVVDKFMKLGYSYDHIATNNLRKTPATYPNPCYWFSNTLLVFRKYGDTDAV